MTTGLADKTHFKVAIVGAGFSGLGTAIRLKQSGMEDFVVLERAAGLGGVWRDNVYPGCACDVESLVYSFTFAPNPGWSRSFSPQPEILQYLRDCAETFGVMPHIRFGQAMSEAAWDEARQRWTLTGQDGSTISADLFVAAVGALSEPLIPEIPGLPAFEGKVFHSSRWDLGFPLEGKRVAVVGTGASAVQIVPAIQPLVSRLHLYQRTPAWVMPRHDRAFTGFEHRLFQSAPLTERLAQRAMSAFRELFVLPFLHPAVGRLVERSARAFLKRSVPDAALRDRLTPRYRIGCKRIVLSDDYFPALTRPNVEVLDGVASVRGRTVMSSTGAEREVDALVLATGFHVTDPPFARHVRGRGGRLLADDWSPSPKAHLGMTVCGYPNLFVLLGPNSGLGHSSVVLMVESQIQHLLHALQHMDLSGMATVEPRPEAQEAFVKKIDQQMQQTVWSTGGCASWYVDRGGRNSAIWPRSIAAFARRVEPFRPSEYLLQRRTP